MKNLCKLLVLLAFLSGFSGMLGAQEAQGTTGIYPFEVTGKITGLNPAASSVSIDGQAYKVTEESVIVAGMKLVPLYGTLASLWVGSAVGYDWYEGNGGVRLLKAIEVRSLTSTSGGVAGGKK